MKKEEKERWDGNRKMENERRKVREGAVLFERGEGCLYRFAMNSEMSKIHPVPQSVG